MYSFSLWTWWHVRCFSLEIVRRAISSAHAWRAAVSFCKWQPPRSQAQAALLLHGFLDVAVAAMTGEPIRHPPPCSSWLPPGGLAPRGGGLPLRGVPVSALFSSAFFGLLFEDFQKLTAAPSAAALLDGSAAVSVWQPVNQMWSPVSQLLALAASALAKHHFMTEKRRKAYGTLENLTLGVSLLNQSRCKAARELQDPESRAASWPVAPGSQTQTPSGAQNFKLGQNRWPTLCRMIEILLKWNFSYGPKQSVHGFCPYRASWDLLCGFVLLARVWHLCGSPWGPGSGSAASFPATCELQDPKLCTAPLSTVSCSWWTPGSSTRCCFISYSELQPSAWSCPAWRSDGAPSGSDGYFHKVQMVISHFKNIPHRVELKVSPGM